MSIAHWTVALLCLASCGDNFTFEVRVGVPAEVTRVDVGGEDLSIERNGNKRVVTLDRGYSSYAAAMGDDPAVFTFHRAVGNVEIGMARAGSCATDCLRGTCPGSDEIDLESLTMSEALNFSINDYACMKCAGGGKLALICE